MTGSGSAATISGATGGGANAEAALAGGAETFYHALLQNQLTILRRGMILSADRLEAWARLVNGVFAPGGHRRSERGYGGKGRSLVADSSEPGCDECNGPSSSGAGREPAGANPRVCLRGSTIRT